MNCECTEKVSQLIDGELSEAEARAMQRHVNECRECQQAREDFLSLRSQIANYVPAVSPASQADALARIVGRQSKVEPSVARAKPRFAWNFSFGAVAKSRRKITRRREPIGKSAIYRSEDGRTKIDVMLDAETLWMNQKQLAELFGKAKGTVSEHIKHILEDGASAWG